MSQENSRKRWRDHPLFYVILFAAISVLLIILDQATKWIVQNALKEEGASVCLISNFLYITLHHNTGAAFSFGSGTTWGRVLNIIISLAMSAFFIAYYVIARDKTSIFMKVILCLLSAGAVGNLIDRAFYFEGIVGFDGVIDWIQFYLGGGPETASNFVNPFATFNLADSYLVIGVILFILYLILDSIKDNKRKQEEENAPHVVSSDPDLHKDE